MRKLMGMLSASVGFFILSGGIAVGQVSTGTISGTVRDSTGAVLPNAQVVVLNEDTGSTRTVQTNAVGRYSAPALNLGNYRVTATLQGFQTEVRRGILLTVGREAVVDMVLTVGGVEQTIEVTGEAPLVESTSAALGSLVDERTIRDLPLNGRSYDQLAVLQPGVTLTAPGRASTGNFQYGSGARFSVGGSRPNQNSFLLDGTDVNDQANGTPGGAAGTNLGVDTIREFKIYTNSFSAEFGRSQGAVMSAVTRSGTNELHGSGFEYIRNSALDAKNFFDVGDSPPPFRRNQFGGTIGGPIKRDKTFFFGGYEGLREGLATTLTADVPTALARQGILPNRTVTVNPEIVRFLDLYPAPNGEDNRDGTAEFLHAPTQVTNQDNFMVRVDHQLNEKHSLFGRYTFDDDSVTAPEDIPNFEAITASRRQYATVQVNSVLGPQVVNHFHFAYNRSFQLNDSLPINELGPEFSFKPGEIMGILGTFDESVTQVGGGIRRFFGYNLFEWVDDVSYFAGKHSLKAGVSIRRIRDNTAIEQGVRGEYEFLNLADMLTGTVSRFEAVPLGRSAYRGYRQTMFGVYVQDDITVSPRLTLNLGLRWEEITNPTEVNGLSSALLNYSDPELTLVDELISLGKKNFQPRVGAAWRLNDRGTTVLRVGAGAFHNLILPHVYAGGMSQAPPLYGIFVARGVQFPNGYLDLSDPGTKPRLRVTAPVMKTPVSYQYNLSLQQQIFEGTVVEVTYAGRTGRSLISFTERNTPNYTILADGRKSYPAGAPRRNPNLDSNHVYETSTNSLYNSMTLTLRHRSSSGLQSQVFYTFSKAMDALSGTAFAETGRSPNFTQDPEDWKNDWSPSDFDAKHNFVFNLTYPLPFQFDSRAMGAVLGGWSISTIGTFTAGLPLTPIMANNNSRDGNSTRSDRPDLKPGASNNPVLGGPDKYYDPTAFSRPTPGTYGNLGRNTIRGPGFANLDISLEKNFPFRESGNVRFRAELFNVMNHPNFDLPNITALAASGNPQATAGRVTRTVTTSRQIQFALRINF